MRSILAGIDGERLRRDDELRVSTLELFFDLVFVFTLTQLTALLDHELSVTSAAHAVLIFVVLFWMYGGYVWLTNQVPPDRPARRLLLILGMGAFFVCALAIPEAFDGGGVAFGLGYLLVMVVHAGLWLQSYGAGVTVRFGVLNVVSALLILAAGFLDGAVVYGLWVAAIVLEFVTPRIAGRAAPRFPIRPGHFVERHGLLLIVALGESVVAIGIGLAGVPLEAGLIGAAVLGLALAAALWWAYFVGDEEGAERAMRAASEGRRFQLAINAYFFAFIPILLGIITAAAGIERSIAHASEPLDIGSAIALGLGVAMYLAGDVAFRLVMGIRPVGYRVGAALLAPATVPIGVAVAAAAQLMVLVGIVVGAVAVEAARSGARTPGVASPS